MNSRDSLASLANDQSLTATIELIEQAIGRLQAGESLDIEALAAAHPEQAAALRELRTAMARACGPGSLGFQRRGRTIALL